MHVLIINGSPRIKKFSNTDKILGKFTKGLCENGTTFEQYEVSDKEQWDKMREAYYNNDNVLIALPLYVECIPGLLLEFLETLKPKNDGTKIAFILQSGFAEGIQLRCGEAYLEILARKLGCEYMGTLVKGDNFSIRFFEGEQQDRITEPYTEMGREYSKQGNFRSEDCKKFTGPEVFPAYVRFIVGLMQKTVAKKMFAKVAQNWGCTKAIDYKPYS
ncbi:MAG: NAD(P)H-dependent oxidoreductase [Lachnospiraceae bacterium]|nr:NAD(P)H-dependent oxidoreductase [Lachnospiraceae bacterium]